MLKINRTSLAAIIFSMMIFQTNANAFWLDIVKAFVSGAIKVIEMPKSAKTFKPELKPDKPDAPQAPKPSEPLPEDIFAALERLNSICGQEFAIYVPCAVGIGKNFNMSSAQKEAAANARVELANIMGTYVEANAELAESKIEDNEGALQVANSYIGNAKLTTKQLVVGAQQYLSYTYIDEEATEINKGRRVYLTTVVMVMNKKLFSEALEEAGKEKPLSEQIIRESRKGIVSVVKDALKRI
jgi:hypothetical protein